MPAAAVGLCEGVFGPDCLVVAADVAVVAVVGGADVRRGCAAGFRFPCLRCCR